MLPASTPGTWGASLLARSFKPAWRLPAVGPLLHHLYLRLFRGDGKIAMISGGYLKGWKLHRFVRSVNPRHMAGEYEPFLQEAIVRQLRPGAIFFDVGANAGFLSLVAAKALNGTGKVVAFEPHPETASEARQQVEVNHLSNVVVVAAAVSDTLGFVELEDSGTSDTVKFASLQEGRPGHKLRVPTVTLDGQVLEHGVPDVVKIDIEGAEMFALRGARKLLRDTPPTLLIEVHTEALSREVYAYLESFGYRFCRVSGKEITDRSYVRFIVAKVG